jgi:hypothetical protein
MFTEHCSETLQAELQASIRLYPKEAEMEALRGYAAILFTDSKTVLSFTISHDSGTLLSQAAMCLPSI